MRLIQYFYILILILITGCTTVPNNTPVTNQVDQASRSELLKQHTQWQVNGRIAFIQPDKRQSANLIWHYNAHQQINKIDLSTFLGINILKVDHANGLYQVEFDDESYQSKTLDELIYNLTGLIIPTHALSYWMQAIPYLDQDVIVNNANNLPQSITSNYQNTSWKITYKNYRLVQGIAMPHSIAIKHKDISLKIAVKQLKYHIA